MKTRGMWVSKGSAKIVETVVAKPAQDEVLIETKACGICQGDVYVYQGKRPGGRVRGHEGAGIVAARALQWVKTSSM
jgi:Zn-dependent alcohol dehydrogenase